MLKLIKKLERRKQMRHRNIKGAHEKLKEHSKVIQNPQEHKGKWSVLFNNNNPIYIEIGMGKGSFIIEQAKANPNINFIGFEKFTAIIAIALKKIDKETELPNLLIVREDAGNLKELFNENEIDGLFLNFSDPWPKERHAKRRLTHKSFLEKYSYILKKESNIFLKTDNSQLFEFSLEQIREFGFNICDIVYNLHRSPYMEDNIMTEYEAKFTDQGKQIYMIHVKV